MVGLKFGIKAAGLKDPRVKAFRAEADKFARSAPTAFFDREHPDRVIFFYDDVEDEPQLVAAACRKGATVFDHYPRPDG